MALFQSASITFGLTFLLLLAGQTSGALICKEDNSGNQPTSKTKPSKSSANTFELSSVQRSHQVYPPIVTRWKTASRTLTVPSYTPAASESVSQQRIMVPIGVSHYRPVEYVDSFKPSPFPHSYFDKVMASVANRSSTETGVNNTIAASSDINEVKVSESGDPSHPVRVHPTRFIELESSYVPLNIRFPSRATKLNIIPGDNDLVGQDSNRHDSFGRRTTAAKNDDRSVNLDSRVIFGEEKRDEPLVLKEGGKTAIPNNMQRIIKCIFPDFHFDGEDKVQSAC